MTDLLDAALRYAGRNWPVFPCRDKQPLVRNGLHDATTDRATVERWWTRVWPDAQIALATGRASGLVVLDVDGQHGGDALAELERQHGRLPNTASVETPSGGEHFYFRHPGGEIRSSAGKLGAGLDVRADGGYVIAPPSPGPNGRRYEPDEQRQLADAPGWLVQLIRESASRRNGTAPAGEAIPEGQRNATLASLAGSMRRRGMDESAILAALRETNRRRCRPPLPDAEVQAIAASIARYEPLDAEPPHADPEPAGEQAPSDGTRPAFRLTDLGNAERLVARCGERIRHASGIGWLVWDGRRWRPDDTGALLRLAKQTARAIYNDAANCDDDEERKRLVGWARASESEPRLRAMVNLAASERQVVVRAQQLDANPWLLNALNGTVDLRTGRLRPHDPADLITKLAPAAYHPEARSERWEHNLERVTGDDAELANFLQRLAGYTIIGVTDEEVLALVHGPGATGKTTTVEAIKTALGDYAATADFETFLQRRGDAGIRNDIARLAGVRMVASVEVENGRRLAEGLIKQITGGDRIAARFLHREYFEFEPRFTLWLVANARPRAHAEDDALWRRILLVPFEAVIPEAERDPELKRALRADPNEQAAVLAWLVRGCLDWQQRGLDVPERVRACTRAYRAENDPLADWIADECHLGEDKWTLAKDLRAAYDQWCQETGTKPLDAGHAWGAALKAHSCTRDRRRTGHGWQGIAVTRDPVTPRDP